ncbi:winged helix DNA-binding protein [uncultured Sphingomonas sp.]|mgnify:FL=1|uniref:winged helix DNA-binding protein n=1 Tax=uncultured Sphingomonas sp. TaxID=158754 RepID=UPI002604A8B6|nr:winged helix DNA-binding protein [uncultured Sphingomonas sp.]
MWKDQRSSHQSGESQPRGSASYVSIAEAILAARRKFGRSFGFDLATDAAGDMLLYLYIREHEGRSTSLSALWGASNVAYSTARRCVAEIEQRGIVQRVPDPTDGRRYLVRLTAAARQQIEAGLDLIGEAAACAGFVEPIPK